MNPFTKILVVEDEPTSAKLVTYHLRMMGFKNTTEVADGNSALEHLKKDWHMPNMNGLNLFRAIREEELWQDIPFLMITVEKDHQKVQEAIQAGVRDYIVKPINVEMFKRKIRELFKLNEV